MQGVHPDVWDNREAITSRMEDVGPCSGSRDDEALHTPGLLKAHYYDVMIHGPKAWLYRDFIPFLDSFYYNQL